MEDKNKSQDLTKSELFYGSNTNIHIDNESLDDINKKSLQNIDFILKKEDEYHYLCPNCFKFPFIEFCKTKKYVKLTCSCYFSKIISIIDLFDESKNYITRNNLGSSGLLSSTIIMNNYENNNEGLKCKEHNRCFKYFCKTCLLNLCDECIYEQNSECHKLVDLESLKINYAKLNTLINIINSNNINDLSLSENIQNIKVYLIDENNGKSVSGIARPPRLLAPLLFSLRALEPLRIKKRPFFTISQWTSSNKSGTFWISSTITNVSGGNRSKLSRNISGCCRKRFLNSELSKSM